MADKYEYHKQNDYPGERTAEKKRVADRADAAGDRSDARVAERGRIDELKADNRVARRGRMDDELMDSEIERSTARATRVRKARNASDAVGLIVIAGVLIILVAGLAWSYVAMQQQNDKIDSLYLQIANSANVPSSGSAQLDNANKQIQLYKDFIVMTADVKEEVRGLEDYDASYSNLYQICANYMEKTNNINHAMNRFAEKEIVYYRQIAVLANKPQCVAKIDKLELAMASSKAADELYYLQNMDQCGRMMDDQTSEGLRMKADWKNAFDDAAAKAKVFTNAERDMIACFA